MSELASIKNPLVRKGASQTERLAEVLLPDNVRIDDRGVEDLLAFAYRFAELVRYYDENNLPDGNWQDFFRGDILTILSVLASEDTDALERRYRQQEIKYLEDHEAFRRAQEAGEDLPDPDPHNFRRLIDIIHEIPRRIKQAFDSLPRGHRLQAELHHFLVENIRRATLDNKVQNAFIRLIGYDKGNEQPTNDYTPFFSGENTEKSHVFPLLLPRPEYDGVFPDTTYTRERLRELFFLFFKALVWTSRRADEYFRQQLAQEPNHPPHITLFLAFLHLFRHAQDHLNGLTRKHLDFYYRQVLRLPERREQPDRIHVIFQLARHFDPYRLTEGVQMLAGKDAGNRNRIYELIEELVVNAARVREVKTVFTDPGSFHVFAAADARLADGETTPFLSSADVRWRALGGPEHSPGYAAPLAQVGFAIASPVLALAEGTRTITLDLNLEDLNREDPNREDPNREDPNREDPNPANTLLSTPGFTLFRTFQVFVSTAKKWEDLSPLEVKDDPNEALSDTAFRVTTVTNPDSPQIRFTIRLEPDFPAVTPLEKPDKEWNLPGDWPAVLIFLNPQSREDYGYQALKDLGLKTVDITVRADGVQNLILENNLSLQDPGKPVMPFGPTPRLGSAFLIGSPEVFQKDLTALHISFFWENLPEDFGTHYADYGANVDDDSFQVKCFLRKDGHFLTPLTFRLPTSDVPVAEVPLFDYVAFYTRTIDELAQYYNVAGRLTELNEFFLRWGLIRYPAENEDQLAGIINSLKAADDGQFLYELRLMDEQNLTFNLNTPVTGDLTPQQSRFLRASVQRKWRFKQWPFQREDAVIKITKIVTPFRKWEIADEAVGNITRPDNLLTFDHFDQNLRQGFIRLELSGSDFLHESYPEVYTRQAAKIAKNPAGADKLPKPPYTPLLSDLCLDYEAKATLDLRASDRPLDRFFHLFPFTGIREVVPASAGRCHLLPHYYPPLDPLASTAITQDMPPITYGNLFIGIENSRPGQLISLLFQILEGSGDGDYLPPPIQWSYLAGNTWTAFTPDQIALNTTRPESLPRHSLLKSGLIRFAVPREISEAPATTLLDPGLFWIRASTGADAEAVAAKVIHPAALPDLVAVRAQASVAEFVNLGNSLEHLDTALPPRSVSQLWPPRAAIPSVEQPYSSFGGRPREKDDAFYRRISERLRHKDRAVNIWDYERLVLEQFPALYKVKCLNHTDARNRDEMKPGFVTVAVIPDPRDRNFLNALEPRVPIGTLADIRAFLLRKTNLFLTENACLQVVNPLFEPIKVTCCVTFHDQLDPDYYRVQLNRDLKAFLAPWAFERPEAIQFGAELRQSAIINFIEERDYVDLVLDFSVDRIDRTATGQLSLTRVLTDVIQPSTSWSVLTSNSLTSPEHDIRYVQNGAGANCLRCPPEGESSRTKPM